MDITPLDVDALDLATAEQVVAVLADAQADVEVPDPTGQSWLLATRHGVTDRPTAGLWLAHDAGALVGWANLLLPRHEQTDVAFVGGAVRRGHQRRGVGRALLDSVRLATDRPLLRARAFRGSGGGEALRALGFAPTGSHVVRRLELRTQVADASARAEADDASTDYALEARTGPTPAHLLPEMVVLREAINDDPGTQEREAYPVERIRAYEQALALRRQTQHTVVARHRATGEPAGLTMVCVDETAPAIAFQEDTSVLREHRGRRLGLRLKLAMADRLREQRPDVGATDTWNAPDNAPMIAVNERLGCRVVAESERLVRQR